MINETYTVEADDLGNIMKRKPVWFFKNERGTVLFVTRRKTPRSDGKTLHEAEKEYKKDRQKYSRAINFCGARLGK